MEQQSGILTLQCLKGTEMKACDLVTKMDPYIKVNHKNFNGKTETIKSGGSNVDWKHTPWKFKVSTTDEITIIGKDKDKFTSNDVIGACVTKIEKLIFNPEVVLDHDGKFAGVITFKVDF